MEQLKRLLVALRMKVELDGDFKLAPSGLGHLEGRVFDRAHRRGVGLRVQLELHLFDEVGYVGVVDPLDRDCPLVGVVGGRAGRPLVGRERGRNVAIDYWPEDADALVDSRPLQ